MNASRLATSGQEAASGDEPTSSLVIDAEVADLFPATSASHRLLLEQGFAGKDIEGVDDQPSRLLTVLLEAIGREVAGDAPLIARCVGVAGMVSTAAESASVAGEDHAEGVAVVLGLGEKGAQRLVRERVAAVAVLTAAGEGVCLIEEEAAAEGRLDHLLHLRTGPADVRPLELESVALDEDVALEEAVGAERAEEQPRRCRLVLSSTVNVVLGLSFDRIVRTIRFFEPSGLKMARWTGQMCLLFTKLAFCKDCCRTHAASLL